MRHGPRISLQNLTVRYDGSTENEECRAALTDVTLTCQPGSATLLTGPSGSGKSTILRVLSGLSVGLDESDISGVARIGDIDCTRPETANIGLSCGTVFQNPRNQFFTATVVEELAFAMCNYGIDPSSILEAVESSASANNVAHLLDRKVLSLSGGQMQRVACASALTPSPSVLLLDEPTSNLSVEDIAALRELLVEAKRQGMTILIAEHRVYYCNGLVDQVALLRKGCVDRVLSGKEFFDQTDEERQALGLRSLTCPEVQRNSTCGNTSQQGIRISSLQHRFGGRRVLGIEDLRFPRGQVNVVEGPCGAGKTTLARVIAGLAKPSSGCITFDGQEVSARRRTSRCAMVMQDVHRQLFGLSVEDELTTGTTHREGLDVSALLDSLDLTQFAHRHPMSLSGGQKQRVVLGAALASDADVFLFDEPTSGVDYLHLQGIAELVCELAERNKVVVVITHDVELIAACADQVVTLGPLEGDLSANPLTVHSAVPTYKSQSSSVTGVYEESS